MCKARCCNLQVKRRAVGEKHAEYVQSLVALAELKHVQGRTPDALLLFKEAAEVLQHQDPTFSAGPLHASTASTPLLHRLKPPLHRVKPPLYRLNPPLHCRNPPLHCLNLPFVPFQPPLTLSEAPFAPLHVLCFRTFLRMRARCCLRTALLVDTLRLLLTG